MFIALRPPNPDGAVRRSGTQVYRYSPSAFRSSERRIRFVLLGSINISLLRSEDLAWNEARPSQPFVSMRVKLLALRRKPVVKSADNRSCPNSVLLCRGTSPTVREGSDAYPKRALPDGRANAPLRAIDLATLW